MPIEHPLSRPVPRAAGPSVWSGRGETPSADREGAPMSPFAPLGDWVRLAVCDGMDPHLFDVPEPGDDPLAVVMRQRAAAEACAACPVRSECLADALDTNSSGIRGGLLLRPYRGTRPPVNLMRRYRLNPHKENR